jgi:hypothetical protein
MKEKILTRLQELGAEMELAHPNYDIFYPSHNLAININEINSHRTDRDKNNKTLEQGGSPLDKNFHLDQTKKAKEQGVQLLHLYNWNFEKDLDRYIDFIAHKLGGSKRVNGHLELIEIKNSDKQASKCRQFLREQHIMKAKHGGADTFICLTRKEEIVACMSFKQKKSCWEMTRFAASGRIYNPASRLLNHFIELYDPEVIETYSNDDFGFGEVYEKIGFKLKTKAGASLQYYHRQTKGKLSDVNVHAIGTDRYLARHPNYFPWGMGDGLPLNREILLLNGFSEVYDAGNSLWVWKKGEDNGNV